MSAAGVLKSSTFDLLTYGKAQLFTADPILDKAVKLTHLPTFSGVSNIVGLDIIGLGWFYPSQDPNLLQHSGSTNGYRSFICVDLKRQIALVILTNNNTPERVAKIGEKVKKAIRTN